MTDETDLEAMCNSLTLLLGMATAMLFELDKKMTEDQTRFFKWWKESMYGVVYEGKTVPLGQMLEKFTT
jgi:hypothetical protein